MDIVLIVTPVERIDDYDICFRLGLGLGLLRWLGQLRQRAENGLLLQVTQRLADNVAALCNSIANVLLHCWRVVCELRGNASHISASMPHVAAAAREEEACCEPLLFPVPALYCLGDGLPVSASPLS